MLIGPALARAAVDPAAPAAPAVPARGPVPAEHDVALHRLLDAHLSLAPEYKARFTSHLPMALHALSSLGADAPRMEAFFAMYARRLRGRGPMELRPMGGPRPLANPTFRSLLGRDDALPSLLSFFDERVTREGVDATLRAIVPVLMQGVASAVFHGAIRAAHAVESGHAGEVAAALAYWAWRFQPAPRPTPKLATTPLRPLTSSAWTAALIEASGRAAGGGSIATRMEAAAATEAYAALADALSVPMSASSSALSPAGSTLDETIAMLAPIAARLYLATEDFTVLHLVTGLRALRVLSPWAPRDEAGAALVRDDLLRAFALACLSSDLRGPAPSVPKPSSWPEVIAAAIASDDDHVVKLVHACREEGQVYGEGVYLQAAALAVQGG